uniref:UBA domain containing 2 n=1 Tax=Ornithorhynchus anatinus TaxID=9258 RepID=K7EBC4_ORNAN
MKPLLEPAPRRDSSPKWGRREEEGGIKGRGSPGGDRNPSPFRMGGDGDGARRWRGGCGRRDHAPVVGATERGRPPRPSPAQARREHAPQAARMLSGQAPRGGGGGQAGVRACALGPAPCGRPLPHPLAGGSGPGTMFSSTGSSGLYKAPLSKSLLLVPSALSILLTLLLQHYQKYFVYNLRAVKDDFQIWRLISGRIICLDLKDTFCSSLLIYNFRIFERRYGSRKFASFLLGSWILSALFDLILVEALYYSFGVPASSLPSGFLGPIFALFVPFYRSIPRMQVTQILGQFSITNKTLIYILGLQISGVCYDSSVLKVHRVLGVPSWMARFFSSTLEPIFSSAEPTSEIRIGMGATVDIQRQQRMELLDRQLMLSQIAQMRRQRQQQGGMINWNRLFPSLRQRRNANYQDNPPSGQEAAAPPLEVSEEQPRPTISHCRCSFLASKTLWDETRADHLGEGTWERTAAALDLIRSSLVHPHGFRSPGVNRVARLMEMGFSRVDALEALRASNNDLNVATNFLLQH